MNQYQEAIKVIKSNYPPSNYSMLREALGLSIKLLEKATPKKVLNEGDGEYTHKCPNCLYGVGTIVVDDLGKYIEHDDYCSTCGQRLDWSDIYV